MKKAILIVFTSAAIISFTSCKKESTDCALVAAKIIRYDCDRVIFQFLTTENIGDTEWEDVQTGQRYSNVASFYNNCKIAEFTKGEKVTLYVSLKQADPNPGIPDNCVRCEALSQNPPQTKVDFTEISKTICEESAR